MYVLMVLSELGVSLKAMGGSTLETSSGVKDYGL